jgi:hypothetical protein
MLARLLDNHRAALGLSALVLVVSVGLAAVAVPWLAFADEGELSDHSTRVTKTNARLWSTIPPLRLQITQVDRYPETGDALPDAAVAWRTIFGVRYGETRFLDGQSEQTWDHAPALQAWLAFGVVESLLLAFAGWALWTEG